jgi:hypothetical protein
MLRRLCAVLFVVLVLSPVNAPFQTCGDTLIPVKGPSASDTESITLIGPIVESGARRVTALTTFSVCVLPHFKHAVAFDPPLVLMPQRGSSTSLSSVLRR